MIHLWELSIKFLVIIVANSKPCNLKFHYKYLINAFFLTWAHHLKPSTLPSTQMISSRDTPRASHFSISSHQVTTTNQQDVQERVSSTPRIWKIRLSFNMLCKFRSGTPWPGEIPGMAFKQLHNCTALYHKLGKPEECRAEWIEKAGGSFSMPIQKIQHANISIY